jgi:hypothetical protein
MHRNAKCKTCNVKTMNYIASSGPLGKINNILSNVIKTQLNLTFVQIKLKRMVLEPSRSSLSPMHNLKKGSMKYDGTTRNLKRNYNQ